MSKKTKIIVSIVAAILIIAAAVATAISYTTLEIAKKIESEYNSYASLLTFADIEAGDIKCSGGLSVNCSIDSIKMSSYREKYSINDIKMKFKGSKTRAKIAVDFKFNTETKSDEDSFYSKKNLSYLNDAHISCEYEGKLITEKSLLKNNLLCNIKDADKNVYTYKINTNNIGEIFKDTDFIKLTSSKEKSDILEGIDGIETYLNSLEFKTKIANENNLIDKYARNLAGDDFEKDFIEELKNIEEVEDFKKIGEHGKQLIQLMKEFFINNHKNIYIKVDVNEENKIKLNNDDYFSIEYVADILMDNDFEGIKLTTSAK